MKNMIIFSLIIGLAFIFGCGEPEITRAEKNISERANNPINNPQASNLAAAAPSAPPFNHPSRGLTEEIFVPIQRIVPKVGSAESILRDGSPPELYIAAFQLEPGARGAVSIHLYVGREKNGFVYANHPIRVKAHPSINIYKNPLTYPYGSDTVLYYTDESGQMILEAQSKTGES